MRSTMKDATPPEVAAKKPYAEPRLSVHGTLEALTAGVSGTGTDALQKSGPSG